MAIACFLLATFLPLRPLFNEPLFRRSIALLTSFDADRDSRAIADLL
jgi:hypothetical protein